MFPMLALSFIMNVIMIAWIGICVILALIILIQKGKGGGLSGAFGGAGSGAGLLGTKTGDFLTWVTISLVGLFFLLAIVMGIFLSGDNAPPPATMSAPAGQPTAPADATPPAPAETETPPPSETTDTPADTGGNADNTNDN
jgi:preprotein translocase subunit SecG